MATAQAAIPVTQLSASDFTRSPLWTYIEQVGPQRDETFVRPMRCKRIPLRRYSTLVHARFVSHSDKILYGFMIVSTADGVLVTPGALLAPRYLVLPQCSEQTARDSEWDWALKDRAVVAAALNARATAVFPLQYLLRALVVGETQFRHGLVE